MAIILLGDSCCTRYVHWGEQKGLNNAEGNEVALVALNVIVD